MKITGVDVSPAGGLCRLRLTSDQGQSGISVCHAHSARLAQPLAESHLLERDPRAVSGLWQRMRNATSSSGSDGVFGATIAALDIALWDLKAKINDEPLWKTLGGAKPRANVHLGIGRMPLQGTGIDNSTCRSISAYGFRAAKLVLGADTDSSTRQLEQLRGLLSQNAGAPGLMIELGDYVSVKESIRLVRNLEAEFDLTWVENAAPVWDFAGLRKISDSISAAICAGKNLGHAGAFLPLLHNHAANVVHIDLAACGITAALQIADAAYGFELPVAFAPCPGDIQAHLAGALPYFMSMEIIDAGNVDPTIQGDFQVRGGWAEGGTRPGHGLDIAAAGTD